MTMHKSCRRFTLCSHPCLAYSSWFQVHPSFLWSFTVGSTHQKSQRCHHFLQRRHHFLQRLFVSFSFALDTVVLYMREGVDGVDAQEVQWTWMLVVYIPEKATTYSKHQRQGGASGGWWDGIQEMWGLLAWPATSLPLTFWVALGQTF